MRLGGRTCIVLLKGTGEWERVIGEAGGVGEETITAGDEERDRVRAIDVFV